MSFKSSQLLHLKLILVFFPFGEDCNNVHILLVTVRVESLWATVTSRSEGQNSCHLVSVPRMCRSDVWSGRVLASPPSQKDEARRLALKLSRGLFTVPCIPMEESLCVGLKYVDPRVLGQMQRNASKQPQDLVGTSKSVKFNLQNLGFKGLVSAWS